MEKVAVGGFGFLSAVAIYKIFYHTNELPVLTIDIGTLIWSKGNTIALIEHVNSYVEYLQDKYQVYVLIEPHFEELSTKFTNFICAPKTQWATILLRLNSNLHIESDEVFGQHLNQITKVIDLSHGSFVEAFKRL